MKLYTTLLLVISFFAAISIAHAEAYAGEDSARHYKSNPEKYNGEAIDVDCVFVTRINRATRVEGVVFFSVHTKDDDNRARGGSIVAAVLEEEAAKFIRRYGDTPDISRGSTSPVDSKRLRATFHQLAKGYIYIDTSEGPAHELITEHRDEALGQIKAGESGVPAVKGKGKVKAKKF